MYKPIYVNLSIMKTLFLLLMFLPANAEGSIEKEVSDISDQLMCPVCRGQTVAESNSALANDFREIIRKKLDAGESEQEIFDYFTERYGESVLASPPTKGVRLIVWLAPPLVIIFGFLLMTRFIYSSSKETGKQRFIDKDEESYLTKIEEEISSPDHRP